MRSLVFVLLCLTLITPRMQAAVIIVDTTVEDEVVNGNCSIREAIRAANGNIPKDGCPAGSGADVIVFGVSGSILLESDLPWIQQSATILGPGAGLLVIDGQDLYELFHFNSLTNDQVFMLKGVTLARGLRSTGGGVQVNVGEQVSLYQVVITANTATVSGGGVSVAGDAVGRSTLDIYWSTISGNMSQSAGGGIHVGLNADVTITESTISGNEADLTGGGINITTTDLPPQDTNLDLIRTTISGNSAAQSGGGIYSSASGATNEVVLTLQSCTVTNNTADDDTDDLGDSGGIYLQNASTATLTNTIVAQNLDNSHTASIIFPDLRAVQVSASFVTNGYNFIGVNYGAATDFPSGNPNANRDYVGTEAAPLDAELDILQDQGGPTFVHLPLADRESPVVDAGSCNTELYDQRGYGDSSSGVRFVNHPDYPDVPETDDRCDIGAVEVLATAMPLQFQPQAILTGPYTPITSAQAKTVAPGEMNTDLRTLSDFPLNQPYNTAPWNYAGSESIGSAPVDLVDWVLVRLYTGNPFSPPMSVVATQAALLMKDGTITDIDGTSPLAFDNLEAGMYWLVVDHRNHLPAMSVPVEGSPGGTAYDFTSTGAWGDAPQQVQSDGMFGLWPGDANADDQVVYIGGSRDQLEIINNLGTSNLADVEQGYYGADMNLDGEVVYIGGSRDQLEIINTLGTANLAGVKNDEVPAAN